MAKKKEIVIPEEPRMSMGSDLLDLLVGGDKGVYGLPFGVILQIYGSSSSGKSFIKNEIIASTYWALGGKDGKLVWESDDCETGDTFDTTRLYGFDVHPAFRKIGNKQVTDSETVEEMDAKVSLLLNTIQKDQFGIYAVDSIDGLSDKTKKVREAKRMEQLKKGIVVADEGDYGAQIAKFLSQDFFRAKHRPLEQKKVSLILISQTRSNIGAGLYAPKTKTSNGDAMEFYCHTRLKLQKVCDIEKNGKIVGGYVKASTTKSKTPRPYREIYYSFYFDYGLDNIGSNIDYLFDLRDARGNLTKSASHIAWSESAKPKNLDNLKVWLDSKGWKDECRMDKKAVSGNNALSVDWILEWVDKDPERGQALLDYFGEEYDRDTIIKLCEDNKEMCAELTRRVREKWESQEDAVATNRPAKYGNA